MTYQRLTIQLKSVIERLDHHLLIFEPRITFLPVSGVLIHFLHRCLWLADNKRIPSAKKRVGAAKI